MSDPITRADPDYNRARRFITLGVQEGVNLAVEAGLEITACKAAAVDVAAFLIKWSKLPVPDPTPELKVVRATERQLRLPFDRQRARRPGR